MKLVHSVAMVYVSDLLNVKNDSNSLALSNIYTSLPSESYKITSKSPLCILDLNENFILSPVSPENEIADLVVVGSEWLLFIFPNDSGRVNNQMLDTLNNKTAIPINTLFFFAFLFLQFYFI